MHLSIWVFFLRLSSKIRLLVELERSSVSFCLSQHKKIIFINVSVLLFQPNVLTLLPVLCWTIVTCILPSVFPVENKRSKDVEQLFCTGSLSPETALACSLLFLKPGLMLLG